MHVIIKIKTYIIMQKPLVPYIQNYYLVVPAYMLLVSVGGIATRLVAVTIIQIAKKNSIFDF